MTTEKLKYLFEKFKLTTPITFKSILLALLLLFSSTSLSQNKIAITFDDLPCTNCKTLEDTKNVNKKLIETFKTYKLPAIGFINENKLYINNQPDENKIDILKEWLSNDLELGNHTFSHIYINNSTIEQYKADIIKGEIITKQLTEEYGKILKYFRHPQLRTGPTPEYKAQLDKFLSDNNYTVAPVTMDNDDYIYGYCYNKAKLNGDTATMDLIAKDYLSYMESIFMHFEKVSFDFLDYNLNQILLLHANELNADYLPSLLNILKNKNYTFISLDEALKDSAYQLPESSSERGLSWLFRWQLAKGQTYIPQPDVTQKIHELFLHYQKNPPKPD